MTGGQREAGPQAYQIRVGGRLGQTIRSAFPALEARLEDGDTVLTGVLVDQAALYGVLAEAEALGLELIEVHRLPNEPRKPQKPSKPQEPREPYKPRERREPSS